MRRFGKANTPLAARNFHACSAPTALESSPPLVRTVRRFKEGDRVWAYEWGGSKTGFYAEYAAPNEKNVAHAPDELTLIEAGAAAVTGLTALQGVDDHLKLDKSDTILVFGATGAVVVWLCNLPNATGAHVVATGVAWTRGNDVARDWDRAGFRPPRRRCA